MEPRKKVKGRTTKCTLKKHYPTLSKYFINIASEIQFKCQTLTSQDSSGVFQALPFEVAHGVVRTVVLRASCLTTAKEELAKLRQGDPTDSKAKTREAAQKVQKLSNETDRFIVFNRRTGQVATADWLTKHVTSDAEGRPIMKAKNSKNIAWIMTLKISLQSGELNLQLRSKSDQPFRRVRCFDLTSATSKLKLASFQQGYGYLLEDDGDNVEEVGISVFPPATLFC